MKKTIFMILLGLALGIIIMQLIGLARIKKIEKLNVLYEVRVNTTFINVRQHPTTISKKVYEVNKNEVYEVIEEFDEDINYKWYKILFSDRRVGWIASNRNDEWIIEIK